MQNDNDFPVTYYCNDCGRSHTVAGESQRQISAEFKALGWDNDETSEGQFVEVCPNCVRIRYDEALELEREEQADNDFFLAGTGAW